MLSTILRNTLIPITSLFIFTISNGFFMTFVSVRLHELHYPSFVIGSMTMAFYLGLGIASLGIDRVISNVGHIRVFAALASALSVVVLAQGLWINPWVWLLCRFASGFFTAGLFVVIESWLLLLGTPKTRGQVIAIYMVAIYAAQSCGQFFIDIPYLNTLLPYILASMLASLSIIPMSLLRIRQPVFEEPTRLSFLALYRISASGVLSCFFAGLMLGAVYGLIPVYLLQKSGTNTQVSWLMAVVILGGMLLQYPIGRLSDHFSRRLILILIALAIVTLAGLTMLIGKNWLLIGTLLFFFGGLVFTIYPVGISLACDQVRPEAVVSVTQSLLLAYSIGSVLGPILAPFMMHIWEPEGLFVYFAIMMLLLTVFLTVRQFQTPSISPEEQEPFNPLPQTTPVAAEMHPQQENEKDKQGKLPSAF